MAEKKIKGEVFKVDIILATTSVRLQARLLKVAGSGVDRLPVILAGVGKGATPEQKEASNAAAIAAFTDIFHKGDPDEMTDLIKDIVELAQVKEGSGGYRKVDMDLDFSKNKAALFPVIVFVLREALGDFFSELLASGALKRLAQD